MTQRVPGTPLPNVGENDGTAHAILSRQFQEHTDIEIDKENRLQASEKIWGSVAHALKAVAEQRGWQHKGHNRLQAIASQLAHELALDTSRSRRAKQRRERRFRERFIIAESMHTNYYENEQEWADIVQARDNARAFIRVLDAIRELPPTRYAPRNSSDQFRLARLLGIELTGTREERQQQLDQQIPLRQASDVGLSPNFGYQIPRLDDGDNGPDDDGRGRGGNGRGSP